MNIEMRRFQAHGDARGQLVALEAGNEIPFDIKRVYYVFDTGEGVRRGYHAHRSLEQVLVCVHGSCTIMVDDGNERREVLLDSPEVGLYIGPVTWREMHDFSSDAVLMVLASQQYDEGDYIRDYNDFLAYLANGGTRG